MSFNDFIGLIMEKTGIDQAIPSGRNLGKKDDNENTKLISVDCRTWNNEPDYKKYSDGSNMGKIHEEFVKSTYVVYYDTDDKAPKIKRPKKISKDFIKLHLEDKQKDSRKHCLYSIVMTTYSNVMSEDGPKVEVDFVYNLNAKGFGSEINPKKNDKKIRLKHTSGDNNDLHERIEIFGFSDLIQGLIPYACGKDDTLRTFKPGTPKKEDNDIHVSNEYLRHNGNVAFHANSFIGRTLWRFRYFPLKGDRPLRLYKVDQEQDYMCVEANKIHDVKTLIKDNLIKHLYYLEDCSFSYDLKFDIKGGFGAEKLENFEGNHKHKYIGTVFFAISFKYVEKRFDKKYDDIKEVYVKSNKK